MDVYEAEAGVEELRELIAELEQKLAEYRSLLAIANCPDSYCDGSGTCAEGDYDTYTTWQCQWCAERDTALAQEAE